MSFLSFNQQRRSTERKLRKLRIILQISPYAKCGPLTGTSSRLVTRPVAVVTASVIRCCNSAKPQPALTETGRPPPSPTAVLISLQNAACKREWHLADRIPTPRPLCRKSQFVGVIRHFQHNRLYHAVEVGNVSHRPGGEHKYHAVKQ